MSQEVNRVLKKAKEKREKEERDLDQKVREILEGKSTQKDIDEFIHGKDERE